MVVEIFESLDDATKVVGPPGFADFLTLGEVDFGGFLVGGGDAGGRGFIGPGRDDDVTLDGEREDEAIAVVDVLADEVDATRGGGGKSALHIEDGLETGAGLISEVGESLIGFEHGA